MARIYETYDKLLSIYVNEQDMQAAARAIDKHLPEKDAKRIKRMLGLA